MIIDFHFRGNRTKEVPVGINCIYTYSIVAASKNL